MRIPGNSDVFLKLHLTPVRFCQGSFPRLPANGIPRKSHGADAVEVKAPVAASLVFSDSSNEHVCDISGETIPCQILMR